MGNNGIGPMLYYQQDFAPNRGAFGPLRVNGKFGLRDFIDGSSNTAVLSETLKVPGEDWRGVLHYPENIFYHHNWTPNTNIPDNIRASGCVSITRAPCTGTSTAYNNKSMILAARSLHVGGVHVTMGDGSVRFVSNNVNANVWTWVGIPDDGNVVGDF
jgi:hypothetical protein